MEKLTKWDLETFKHGNGGGSEALYQATDYFWGRIEADREAIREETRAEVMRDRYGLGEEIQVRGTDGEWTPGVIVGVVGSGFLWRKELDHPIRRPAKKRALTRIERWVAIQDHLNPKKTGYMAQLSDDDMEKIMELLGIPTEVEG